MYSRRWAVFLDEYIFDELKKKTEDSNGTILKWADYSTDLKPKQIILIVFLMTLIISCQSGKDPYLFPDGPWL